MHSSQPVKDSPTVTPAGERLGQRIHGVVVRRAVTHTDERGTLCEILNPGWGMHPAPLAYVYQFTIRPAKIKGWHLHRLHDVLYDSRTDSPTHRLVNEIFRNGLDRDLMIIPAGVYHAHQNVGAEDALFISMPTRAYNHADPDVYRLPIDNDVIPYRFQDSPGR